MSSATRQYPIEALQHAGRLGRVDSVAVEEPLEIRLAGPSEPGPGRVIAVTMRTPGQDEELAVGFLHGEGIVRSAADVLEARPCGSSGNVVRVVLREGLAVQGSRLDRNFYTSSSCGVCGKTSIEAVMAAVEIVRVPPGTLRVTASALAALVGRMRAGQATFAATGGLHAAALFSAGGELGALREDVGRHNALDKLVGSRLLAGSLPLCESILVLSGRASFELMQKAMAAQVPLVAAIGAPSSLAIDLAEAAGITLVGFLREDGCNVYANGARLRGA